MVGQNLENQHKTDEQAARAYIEGHPFSILHSFRQYSGDSFLAGAQHGRQAERAELSAKAGEGFDARALEAGESISRARAGFREKVFTPWRV